MAKDRATWPAHAVSGCPGGQAQQQGKEAAPLRRRIPWQASRCLGHFHQQEEAPQASDYGRGALARKCMGPRQVPPSSDLSICCRTTSVLAGSSSLRLGCLLEHDCSSTIIV